MQQPPFISTAWVLRPGLRTAACLAPLLAGCVESYAPDVVNPSTGYLVVDGFINGNGRSTFRLSRSTALSATAAPPAERGARLVLADNTGRQYPLSETSPAGTYRSDSLVLMPQRQYQLQIRTTSGGAYASDLVPLKVTPPLDDFSWRYSDGQVQLRLSTHDPAAQARYYRWSLTETWEFTSAYESFVEYRDGKIQNRITPIYTCWHTETSSLVRQASTASLSQDALSNVPLLSNQALTERFKIRYSVLVTQAAQTAAEFNYYELLRKNTEAVGTVNDPLPTQLTGNVHRTDANTDEPVLGFVGAHTVQRQRLFISRRELPVDRNAVFVNPYDVCTKRDTAEILYPFDKDGPVFPATRIFSDPSSVPIDIIKSASKPYAYSGSRRECVDCRLRGSNAKPTFW